MCNASTKTRTCAECGQAYTTKRTETFYCGPKCAAAFNNRMKSRGAKIMPLLMRWRYAKPRDTKAYTRACNLLALFPDEDVKAGRPSFVANEFFTLGVL